MKCDYRKCKNCAVGLFSWWPHTDPGQNNNVPLCQNHLDTLWLEIKRQVQCGDMEYQAKSIPELQK